MKEIDFSDIRIRGDLAVRSGLNYARLEGEWYRPDEVFKADSHGWPGDWEGRALLALTLLEQSTHRASAYLEETFSMLPAHLNEKGYFGPILPEGVFDEQHFGGHSWMLRALAEYYKYRRLPETLRLLRDMTEGFLMPALGSFRKYPIVPGRRFEEQGAWVLSRLQTKTRHHAETSDAGCAFIMIDGATAAYEFLGGTALRELIDEMIARFMEMDLEALHIQTHATLSAARGILRMYELTGEKRYLSMAAQRFGLYRRAAWTEAYGNYNWFGAPRWTEPCAIIDSFIVAVTLWKHTGDAEYLHDAHLIYYNALSHGHRINGSFGTDRCCGARGTEEREFIAPINYETYWCCTMRGGEGFSRAISYTFFTDGNAAYLPFYHASEATLRLAGGSMRVDVASHYPYEGDIVVRVREADLCAPAALRLFIPKWARDVSLRVNGEPVPAEERGGFAAVAREWKAGDELRLCLRFDVRAEDAAFANSVPGKHKYLYGPMLLGYKTDVKLHSLDGNRFENYTESRYVSGALITLQRDAVFERNGPYEFRVAGTDTVLTTLCSVRDMTREDSMRQVLFEE